MTRSSSGSGRWSLKPESWVRIPGALPLAPVAQRQRNGLLIRVSRVQIPPGAPERNVHVSKKKKIKENSTLRAIKKIRNDWGDISPVTKVIPNKKKNPKVKHKGKEYQNED